MSTEFLTMAVVLGRHAEHGEGCCYWCCTPESCGVGSDSFGLHQAKAWGEACTVTTIEQLDALPDDSIVRSAGGSAWHKHAVPGITNQWWCAASEVEEPSSAIQLPALLLWHPSWEQS